MKKKNILMDLLVTFAKVGLFTFGGGYAMIAVIENACVEEKKWITHDEMMNVTVVAESTPGPIAINCATYVGYRQAGFAGAAAATLGIVLPSFLIIFLISSYLNRFLEIPVVAAAFKGIKIAVGVLIAQAGIAMLRKMPKKLLPRVFMGFSFAAMMLASLMNIKLSTIALMLLCGTVSVILFAVKRGGHAA